MNMDIVVHAPGAELVARAALPPNIDAIFGDSAAGLILALHRRESPERRISRMHIVDAYGPNSRHPLLDIHMVNELISPNSRPGSVLITIIRPLATSPFAGQQGGGQNFGGGRQASGFAGIASDAIPSYVGQLRAALGSRISLRSVFSPAQVWQI